MERDVNHPQHESCSPDERLLGGDPSALGEVLAAHRPRLVNMIRLRMDRRLQGRIDPSDVIQDAYLEATNRVQEFLEKRPAPSFFLWLRFLVSERLITLHRHHQGTEKRDVNREISLFAPHCEASSDLLAASLVAGLTGPSEAAVRAETKIRLQQALDSMEPLDRESIALRHFEQLTRSESAQALGIQKAAASKRYLRAMKRLRNILTGQLNA